MIQIKAIEKKYSSEVQIGPIDLELPSRAFISLLGPNGAGKSTLLLMMGRLMKMDAGWIRVADYDVAGTDSSILAQKMAILRQENHFVTRLTIRQLVSFGRFPYSKGRLTAADEKLVSKYIDFLNLGDLENRYLDELSGGQRQRAYVAMVLCQETPYIFLDEPLNNLDICHSVQMMKHLRRTVDEFDRTVVTVMHDINFAAQYSDFICCLKEGKVCHFGTVDSIMQDEILSEIYQTSIEVIKGPHGPIAIY